MEIDVIRKNIDDDSNRYVIIDKETGEIIDDAQGYGYKSKRKAYAAHAYKTKGGKQKDDTIRAFWRKNKEIDRFCGKWLDCFAKEFARKEMGIKDLQNEIKEKFDIEVSVEYLKKRQKKEGEKNGNQRIFKKECLSIAKENPMEKKGEKNGKKDV